MTQDKMAELIKKLKKIREENSLSTQKICDMVEANKEYVSLATIKKVFAVGSENKSFNYQNTLRPIAQALIETYGSDAEETSVDALHAEIRVKDELIEQLHTQIDFLTHQVELKDKRIDTLLDLVVVQSKKEKTI